MNYNLFMGGYDFMVVLWIIFIVVGLFRIKDDYKDELIGVEYVSKKGKQISTSVKIPMGRKIRQAIITEQKRLAAKAAREARR